MRPFLALPMNSGVPDFSAIGMPDQPEVALFQLRTAGPAASRMYQGDTPVAQAEKRATRV